MESCNRYSIPILCTLSIECKQILSSYCTVSKSHVIIEFMIRQAGVKKMHNNVSDLKTQF